jgi:hypothetical protein
LDEIIETPPDDIISMSGNSANSSPTAVEWMYDERI